MPPTIRKIAPVRGSAKGRSMVAPEPMLSLSPVVRRTAGNERIPVLRVRGDRPAAVRRRAGKPACHLDTSPDHADQLREPLRVGRSEGRSAPLGRALLRAFLYLPTAGRIS